MAASHSRVGSSDGDHQVDIVVVDRAGDLVPGHRLGMIRESWGTSSLMVDEVMGATVVESGLWEHHI